MSLQERIEQFLYREARLLDNGDYDAWLMLFAKECRYFVPARISSMERALTVSDDGQMALMDDDHAFLRARIERFKSDLAHAERPPSRTTRLISNVEIEDQDAGLRVRSNFLLHQSRTERSEAVYVGRRVDRLVPADDSWQIVERIVYLNQTLIPRSIAVFF